MDTLKTNMYVRTERGNISKIIKANSRDFYLENGEIYHLYYGDEPKASFNIIDLIEEGDYVNGHRVNYINKDRKHFNISFGDINNNLKSKFNDDIKWLSSDDIKSVVTKEQFENIKYYVKEE